MKGHRRALSGCMPMMGGIGVVAWSSLRELQSPSLHTTTPGLRSRSPIGKSKHFIIFIKVIIFRLYVYVCC